MPSYPLSNPPSPLLLFPKCQYEPVGLFSGASPKPLEHAGSFAARFVRGCVCLWPHPGQHLFTGDSCDLRALILHVSFCLHHFLSERWALVLLGLHHLFFCPWEALDFVRWPHFSQKRSDDVLPSIFWGLCVHLKPGDVPWLFSPSPQAHIEPGSCY